MAVSLGRTGQLAPADRKDRVWHSGSRLLIGSYAKQEKPMKYSRSLNLLFAFGVLSSSLMACASVPATPALHSRPRLPSQLKYPFCCRRLHPFHLRFHNRPRLPSQLKYLLCCQPLHPFRPRQRLICCRLNSLNRVRLCLILLLWSAMLAGQTVPLICPVQGTGMILQRAL